MCLERTIELESVRLSLRDWPGLDGPVVHLADAVAASPLVEGLGLALAPSYRVLSVAPHEGVAYQVAAMDLAAVLRQFGFLRPVLLGEGLGCVPVVIVAAWYPGLVRRIILVDPTCIGPAGESIEARSLRECPPDWPRLRAAVTCDVLELAAADASFVQRVEAFLAARLP